MRVHKSGEVESHQRTCGVQGIGQNESDETGVDTASHQSDERERSSQEDDRRTDELQTDREPPVHRDTWQIADLVPIHTSIIRRDEDRLLGEGSNGRQATQRFGEPGEDGRTRDCCQTLQLTRSREVISEEEFRSNPTAIDESSHSMTRT